MDRRINIGAGNRITIEGVDFVLENMVASQTPGAPDDFQFKDFRSHRIRLISQDEFDRLYAASKITVWDPKAGRGAACDVPPCDNGNECGSCKPCAAAARQRALQQLMIVFDDARETHGISKTDIALQAFLDQQSSNWPANVGPIPKAGVFRRLLRECGVPGDRRVRDLRPVVLKSRSKKPRMHQLVENALWDIADKKFWPNRKFTYGDLHADLVTEIAEINAERTIKGLSLLQAPSDTTVWRMVTQHSDFDHLRRRLGARVAGRMFQPLKGRLTASRILETAIMDHTWFDCHVIDDEHLVPVGRPYLTLLMDVRSRYPLGYVIGFTPPSVETALACLRTAVRPKHDLNERHPDVAPWEVFGAPQTVLVDNGWEFTGSSFQDACNDAGIAVTWAPVRTPEYKGIIERFFGTLNRKLIHKLEGAVPFKPHVLRELGIDPTKEAVLLLSDLDELIHQCVVEVYGRTRHSGIKAVPEQVWKERQHVDGIEYVSDLRALDLAMGRVVERTLDRKGIEFSTLTYSSDEVFGLLNRLLPLAPRHGNSWGSVKVKVKYWPEDLSQVAVWDQSERRYVSLPCIDMEYAKGLSEHHHKKIGEFANANGLKFSTLEQRCFARSRLNQKIADLVQDRRISVRRQVQRLKTAVLNPAPSTLVQVGDQHMIEIETTSNRHSANTPPKSPARGKKVARKAPSSKPATKPPAQAADLSNRNVLADLNLAARAERLRKERSVEPA